LLRGRVDAAARTRLDECIRITAAPKVRVALEECRAPDDDDAIDGAVPLRAVRLSHP
jgi:hypothetical protein